MSNHGQALIALGLKLNQVEDRLNHFLKALISICVPQPKYFEKILSLIPQALYLFLLIFLDLIQKDPPQI